MHAACRRRCRGEAARDAARVGGERFERARGAPESQNMAAVLRGAVNFHGSDASGPISPKPGRGGRRWKRPYGFAGDPAAAPGSADRDGARGALVVTDESGLAGELAVEVAACTGAGSSSGITSGSESLTFACREGARTRRAA